MVKETTQTFAKLRLFIVILAFNFLLSNTYAQATTVTFGFTGGVQTWVVPAGVTSIDVVAKGAKGGDGINTNNVAGIGYGVGGKGGKVSATLAVTPGATLYIYVGEAGKTGEYASIYEVVQRAFYGGGLVSSYYSDGSGAGGGGGATDIRIGGNTLSDRVIVAGAGGGGGTFEYQRDGGDGGGLVGGTALGLLGGEGGAQNAGGAASEAGYEGSFGQGGDALEGYGGGGGSGYYGGGAGASSYNDYLFAGGGGGSSYTNPVLCTNVVHTQGDNNGNGSLTITYNVPVIPISGTVTPACDADGSISVNIAALPLAARYIRIQQNQNDYMNLAELKAIDLTTGNNVALNKVVSTQSSWPGHWPEYFVDGDVNSIAHSGSSGTQEYLEVDLGAAYILDRIEIVNRGDCCQFRASNLLLILKDTSGNILHSQQIDAYQGENSGLTTLWEVANMSWSDGATTLNRTGLAAGNYTLNYNDVTGDSLQHTFNVPGLAAIALVNVTGNNGFSCSGGSAVVGLDSSEVGINYQLKRNGADVGTPIAGTGSAIDFGGQTLSGIYSVVATHAASGCSKNMTGFANIIIENGNVTPAVTISSNDADNKIMAGTPVTFTATATNAGNIPIYQWKKNGNNVGTNSSTYTDATLVNNDAISCVVNSTNPCANPTTATSNSITINIIDPTTQNYCVTFCDGSSITLTYLGYNLYGDSTYSYSGHDTQPTTNGNPETEVELFYTPWINSGGWFMDRNFVYGFFKETGDTQSLEGTYIRLSSYDMARGCDSIQISACSPTISSPTIISFTPSSGCENSASVAITGTGFTGATDVSIGGTPVNFFVVNSATQITAIVGSGTSGAISVTTPNGVATSSTAFQVFSLNSATIPTNPAQSPYYAAHACPAMEWTYFYTSDGKLLLGLEMGGLGGWSPGTLVQTTPGEGEYAVRVDIGASPTANLTTAPYNTSGKDWIVMNRTWDVVLDSVNQEPMDSINVKTYFTEADYQAINALFPLADKLGSPDSLTVYKLRRTTPIWQDSVGASSIAYDHSMQALTASHAGLDSSNLILYNNLKPYFPHWTYEANSPSTGIHSVTMKVDEFSGGGGGGGAGGSTPFPIELLSFKGYNQEMNNRLFWITASELNADKFIVERSINGRTYTSVGEIKAVGNSYKQERYSFNDKTFKAKLNFYRLKMVDKDGSFAYSNIIEIAANQSNVSIYPNPTHNEVFISGNFAPNSQASILNLLGEEVLRTNLDNLAQTVISLQNITQGVYILNILNEKGAIMYSEKLVKE